MSGDLVGGRWPITYPFAKALGLQGNVNQSNVSVRSNAEWFGLGTLTDGALSATEVGTVVAIPIEQGDVFSKAQILIGATKGKKVEAGYAALYAGTLKEQVLLGQSKSAALAEGVLAEKALTFTFESAIQATNAQAPNGYVFCVITLEAETMPTAVSVATAKATQTAFQLTFANAPTVVGGTAGTGLKTKAEGPTLGTITSKAVTPLVFLS